MDQAESSPSPGQPDPQGRPSRTPPPEAAAETGAKVPGPAPHAEPQSSALRLEHPVIAGVYCEPLTGQVVGVPRDAEALERWLLAELDQVTGPCDVEVHVRTRRGSPARELAAAAEEFNADALVIGAPKHIWHRVAGSVSGWLARHARCPVIVVP
jgi:nucleotide-binding universal stress UspA family protein